MKLVLFKPIMNFIDRVKERKRKFVNLIKVLDNMDINIVGDTTIIKISNNTIINTEGNTMIYSKDGLLVTKHRHTHINPAIEINIKQDTDIDDISKRSKIAKMNKILEHNYNIIKTHRCQHK